MKSRISLTLTTIGMLLSTQLQSYPFTLPSTVEATVNIDSSKQQTFNNKLLGTNIFGFTTTTEQSLINLNNPITVRFPHGLWANWYDWETDGTRVFGT